MAEGWSYYLDFNNQMFELEEGERTVGRSRTCDVSVNDPSVSRRHVVLTAENGKVLLKDLGSSNGTFINGERIQEAGELHHGDTLGLGDADLNVRVIGNSAFETVRMQAHPLEGQHGEATLFLQRASQDLAQEAMEIDASEGPGHMVPPAPAQPGPEQPGPPVNPAQTQPPSAAGFAAPPAPQPPPQVVPEPTSPWATPAAPVASAPPPATPATPQRSTQEVTAEGVRYADLGVPTASPPQPGPPAQQAPPPSDVSRPTLSTADAAPPPAPASQPTPPAFPSAPPKAPAAAPPAPAATPQQASEAASPQTPAATPQVAPSQATPQTLESVQMDPAASDLLPSLDGFDVTMGPEMLAAIPVKEEKTEEAPAYNPYSAPSPQGNAAGAGLGIRLLAFLVDELWMLAIGAGLFLAGQGQMVASSAASSIGFLVILFGWAIWGTTPGKRLFNLYVTTGDQAAGIGFPRALARLVGYVASTIPVCIGFLMIAFNKQRRGLHDIIAGTTVRRQ